MFFNNMSDLLSADVHNDKKKLSKRSSARWASYCKNEMKSK